jgi:transposase
MGRRISVIDQECADKAMMDLKDLGNLGVVGNRLQAIISAYKNGVKKVLEVLDLSRDTFNRWCKDYKEHGIEGLMNDKKPPRSKLNEEQKGILNEWISANPTYTLKALVQKCNEEFGLKIGKSSIHRTLISLGYSHITGRKQHHKSSMEKQDEFKKN